MSEQDTLSRIEVLLRDILTEIRDERREAWGRQFKTKLTALGPIIKGGVCCHSVSLQDDCAQCAAEIVAAPAAST